MPLAFMMGVSWEDSFIVAELIGTKTFLNELMAFQKLSKLIMLRNAGGPEYVDNVKQYITVSISVYNCIAFFFFFLVQLFVFLVPIVATDCILEISF